MHGLNKVEIIGNLGSEPELRFTPSGRPVASFSVDVNHNYTTTEGEKRETVEWFNVVVWGKLAEVCNQFLVKGAPCFVEGRQQTQKWESEDGVKHEKKELHASRVIFLSDKKQSQQLESEEESPF